MKISRLILRKLILSEVKKVLSRDHLVEGLIDRLVTLPADEIEGAIQSARDAVGGGFLDDVIRKAIDTDDFKEIIKDTDDETIKAIFGKLRAALLGSGTEKLKDAIIDAKPSLKGKLV
jgi:hypothetical protein